MGRAAARLQQVVRALSSGAGDELAAVPPRLSPPFFLSPAHSDAWFEADPPSHVVHPREVSAAEREAYQRDGFLKVEDFLAPEQLQRLSHHFDVAFHERDFALPGMPPSPSRPSASAQYTQRVNSHQTNAAMREIVFELGKLSAKMASALNDHPQGYRLSVSQLLVKEPGQKPTAWHLVCRNTLSCWGDASKADGSPCTGLPAVVL